MCRTFDSSTIFQLCGCDKRSAYNFLFTSAWYSFGYHISSDAREFDDAFSLSLWMSLRTFVASVSTSTYARLSLRKMPFCLLLRLHLVVVVFGFWCWCYYTTATVCNLCHVCHVICSCIFLIKNRRIFVFLLENVSILVVNSHSPALTLTPIRFMCLLWSRHIWTPEASIKFINICLMVELV